MTLLPRSLACLVALLVVPLTILGADDVPFVRGAEVLGEPVIPHVFRGDLRDLPVAPEWRPGDPVKEIPRRPTRRPTAPPVSPGIEGDPLLAAQRAAHPVASAPDFHEPIVSLPGMGFTGVNPPDTVGDIGPDHYVQAVNSNRGSRVAVVDRSGVVVAGPFAMDSLGSGACASGLGDPIVLYDRQADRFVLAELADSGNRMCVYVSMTSDPVAGGWFNYDFEAPDFPSFAKYAVWSDGYYVSSNESSPAAYALDRENMLLGAAARPAQRFTAPPLSGFVFQALAPADLDGATPPPAGAPAVFARHNDDEAHGSPTAGSDKLELFFFDVDWNTPANSTFTGPVEVSIAEIDSDLCGLLSLNCFEQPGEGADLDPVREVVMWRLQYMNHGTYEAIVGNFVTDVGTDQGGIRWFELRGGGSSWSLFQEGTYSIDSADRWLGSIAQDQDGNIALGYNVVDETTNVFPSIRYVGRLASDPPGTLPQGEHSIFEGTASNNSNRYGDYSSMNLDPLDDCTFWLAAEYNLSGRWATRIAAVKFDSCPLPPSGPTLTVTGGACGGTVFVDGANWEPAQEVALVGAANTNGWTKGGFICPGTQWEIGEPFQLPPTLAFPDASGSFSTSIDLPANRCWLEAMGLTSCKTSPAIDTSP